MPLPQLPSTFVPDAAIFEQLTVVAGKADITVRVVPPGPDGLYGWWEPVERLIAIVDNQDIAAKTATLLHELAHAHDPECLSPQASRAERELVAESAAYLVGTELGIQMSEASAHYVMTYGATAERLLDLASEVLAVAQGLSDLVAELPLPLAG